MTRNIFANRDKLTIAAFLLAGLVGLLVYLHFYDEAFPTASLNMKINRGDALRIGESYLRSMGHDLSGYRSVVSFDYDNSAKEYLERNLGLRKANPLMNKKVDVWYWHIRWFKPLQEEHFCAWIDLAGKVEGFHHEIPEAEPGKRLQRAEAKHIAEKFLLAMGIHSDKYKLIYDSSIKRPKRMDHYFQWKEPDFDVKGAFNRLSVSVEGDKVSALNRALKIPEKWDRKVANESSKGNFFVTIASVIYGIFSFAMFVVFLFAVRAKDIRWRFSLILAGAMVLVYLAGRFNAIPQIFSGYSTTESMGSFITQYITMIIIGAVSIATSIMFLCMTGDVMQRWASVGKTAISRIITSRGLRSKEFARAGLIGFGLGLAHLGYVTAFYVVSQKYFGVWSPAEVPYSGILNTAIPWIYPLTIGLSAALNEELAFRLFATSFLKKYIKLTWLAVLIPAVTWAFLHSNYPQQPPYIRGIEISVVGIVLGIVFLRYGIVATIISHYTFNAVIAGTLLVKQENLYLKISGLIVMALMLLPILPAVISSFRKSEPDEEPIEEEPVSAIPVPLPESESVPETEPEPAPVPVGPPPIYDVISPGGLQRRALVAVAAFIILMLCTPGFVIDTDFPQTVSKGKALEIARKQMRDLGVDTRGYMSYAIFGGDSSGAAADYIAERIGSEKANEMLQDELHDVGWYVSWFKPMQVEGYELWLDPDGRFFSWGHTIEEDTPGANLSGGAAKALASEWLTRHGVDLSGYRLIDSSTRKYDKRTDHYFTWEKKKPRVSKATFRLDVMVQGDQVVNRSQSIKVPDEYLREESKQTTRQSIFMGIGSLLSLLISIGVFIVFVKQFVRRSINWRFALKLSAVFAIFMIIKQIDGIPTFYYGYDPNEPLSRYVISGGINAVLAVVGQFIGMALLIGFADAVYRQAFPAKPSLSQWFGVADRRPWRLKAMREGIVVALTSLPVAGLVVALGDVIDTRYFTELASAESPSLISTIDGISPVLGALPEVSVMIVVPVCLALVVSLLKLYLKRRWLIITAAVGISFIFVCASVSSWPEFAQAILSIAVVAPILWFMLSRWYGHNVYSYAALVLLTILPGSAADLIRQNDPVLRMSGIILGVLALAPIIFAFYPRRSVASPDADSGMESGHEMISPDLQEESSDDRS